MEQGQSAPAVVSRDGLKLCGVGRGGAVVLQRGRWMPVPGVVRAGSARVPVRTR